MQRSFFIIILLVCACALRAQTNLVLNPSFEEYYKCPVDYSQIKLARYWSAIDSTGNVDSPVNLAVCSSEYYNTCATNPLVKVPNNIHFYQFPRTGNGMSDALTDMDTLPSFYKRDYLQGRLAYSLLGGVNYCVTFYVVLTEYSDVACDHIGAYLDDGSIDTVQQCAQPLTAYRPQVFQLGAITDTQNWTKVQGSFTATGNEKFITLGNFFKRDSVSIVVLPYGVGGTYYLIDDVSVIESNAVANAGTDAATTPGAATWIGTHEEGMPCTWYVVGSTVPVGYGGHIIVHPTVTTSYVIEMDLCGNITRDTMTVYVWPTGITSPILGHITTYPNPAHNELHIDGLFSHATYTLRDITGRQIQQGTLAKGDNTIALHCTPGIYTMELSNGEDRQVMRVVVE